MISGTDSCFCLSLALGSFQFGDEEASGAPPTGFIWNKAKDAFCFGLGRFVDGFIVSSKA
jgi:hypothetical protein